MSSARPRLSLPGSVAEPSRLLPFSIAGVICSITALVLGFGAWYLFGTARRTLTSNTSGVTQLSSTTETSTAASPVPPAPSPSATPAIRAPAGELAVPGSEVTLGGDDTGLPVRRQIVPDFFIAETEITNEQYRSFVVATQHSAPVGWRSNEFPPGAANDPVTNVTWQDAVDYCEWLTREIGATVRLPTEAEWELAARGREGFKYPWGNEWNAQAAASSAAGGAVRPVRSFLLNRSPFGAYDMAGNVWEWVADDVRDERGRPLTEQGAILRVIKGGAAVEDAEFISARSRDQVRGNATDSALGFRYVVIRGDNGNNAGGRSDNNQNGEARSEQQSQ